MWVALLGGLYSSTATTVVLARRARAEPATLTQAQTGIILATAVMYLRLLVIIMVFDRALAIGLAPWLAGLSVAGFAMAGARHWLGGARQAETRVAQSPGNPLEVGAAAVFAMLFVAISLASTWARSNYGASASICWPASSACPISTPSSPASPSTARGTRPARSPSSPS